MGEILQKLQTFLGDIDHGGTFGTTPDFDENLMERLFEFVINLDPEQLTEDQADTLYQIIEDTELNFDDGTDVSEEIKKIRIDPKAKRERAKVYKKNKAKIKMKAKKYRVSSRGKMLAKKAKKMAKTGKTATGKRMVSYR